MNKQYVLTITTILTLLLANNSSVNASELSCRHLFHAHEVDLFRIDFIHSKPAEQIKTLNKILNISSTPEYLEITRYKKYHEFSFFEKKSIIDPIFEKLTLQVGFFIQQNLRYTIIKDVNEQTWAILVSEQISPSTRNNIALYKMDYNPGTNKKGPILLQSFNNSAIL